MSDSDPNEGIQSEPKSNHLPPADSSAPLHIEYTLRVEDVMAFQDHAMRQVNEARKKSGNVSHTRFLVTCMGLLALIGLLAKRYEAAGITLDTRTVVVAGIVLLIVDPDNWTTR